MMGESAPAWLPSVVGAKIVYCTPYTHNGRLQRLDLDLDNGFQVIVEADNNDMYIVEPMLSLTLVT